MSAAERINGIIEKEIKTFEEHECDYERYLEKSLAKSAIINSANKNCRFSFQPGTACIVRRGTFVILRSCEIENTFC